MAMSMFEWDEEHLEEPTSVEAAQELLWRISGRLGGPPPSVQSDLQASTTRVQNYVGSLQAGFRKEAEKLIKMTVSSIYSAPSRYLFELIQNADDAIYSQAVQRQEQPYVSFTLTDTDLIVDTNEDGFRAANVRAICTVSESSKKVTADDQSIGEKGIGFKSVFNIAHRVHIQSGVWSFRFDHNKQDPLSMYIPIPTDHQVLPNGVRTRIKLTYKPGNTGRIMRDLRELSQNTIMFLRHLTRLGIRSSLNQQADSPGLDLCFSKLLSQNNGKTYVKMQEICPRDGGSDHTKEKTYRLIKQHFSNMPSDDRRHTKNVETVLAFPVQGDRLAPSTSHEGEDVFAYLPMFRQRQIPFIIQSDFITNTSRENVVSCDWNDQLRENVAQALTAAICVLVQDGFEYNWLDYLPQKYIDGFWSPLPKRIVELLRDKPVLKCWNQDALAPPRRLAYLTGIFLHEASPLFEDTNVPTCYLAPKYLEDGYRHRLKELGLKPIAWSEMMDCVKADLRSRTSRLKRMALNGSWHLAFASFIQAALELAAERETARWIKKDLWGMEIIPLSDGTFASPSRTIYLPQVDQHDIPTNLGLLLVHPRALQTGLQQSLYQDLCVSECPPHIVCEKIMHFQLVGSRSLKSLPPETLVQHLKFLHYAGHKISRDDRGDLLVLSSWYKTRRLRDGIYFPSSDQYDTQGLLFAIYRPHSLFVDLDEEDLDTDIILHDSFLPQDYISTVSHGKTYLKWVQDVLGVRYFPPLTVNSVVFGSRSYSLSPILAKTLDIDSPKFLGVLRTHWSEEYSIEAQRAGKQFADKLREAQVSCTNGESRALKDTFYPTDSLRGTCLEMNIEDLIPFVKLPASASASESLNSSTSEEADWKFLDRFGVSFDSNLGFWFEALRLVRRQSIMSSRLSHGEASRIYESVGRIASHDTRGTIQDFFESEKVVCNPLDSADWKPPSLCLWNGPDFITSRIVLKPHHHSSRPTQDLFVNVLGVRDARLQDLLDELHDMKARQTERLITTSMLRPIYQALDEYSNKENSKSLKDAFRKKLIFVDNEWFQPRDCVWDMTLADLGKPKLRQHYGNLQSFFQQKVGVPTVTATWLLKELKNLVVSVRPDVSKIRTLLLQIGTRVATKDIDDEAAFQQVLEQMCDVSCKFLPVRANEHGLVLRSVEESFVINDHVRYADKFSSHVDILDFDQEESFKLRWLFAKLNLEDRYLSKRVEKRSEPMASLLDPNRTDEFHKRAYALSCCAVKFGSRKYIDDSGMHQRLLETEIFTSDDLRTELILDVPKGVPVSEGSDEAGPSIQGLDDGNIKIFLPASTKDLQRSLRSPLPTLVRELLGIEDASANQWLFHLLTARLSTLYGILDEMGAPSLPRLERPDLESEAATPQLTTEDAPGNVVNVDRIPAAELEQSSDTQVGYESGNDSQRSFISAQSETPPVLREVLEIRPSRPTVAASAAAVSQTASADYAMLLRHIIGLIRRGDMALPPAAVLNASIFGHPSAPGNNYYEKIGAAGELYVYETLRKLNLPGYGLHNWESKVRRHVRALDEYSDMPQWTGPDRDIVVEDESGQLEQWLRENSHNTFLAIPTRPPFSDGRHRKIRFEFEVKSTVGDCSDRMFMSQGQYERMRLNQLSSFNWTGTVFVLARVYRLLDRQPRLALFVDPASLEGNTLRFSASNWEVEARI